jgi:hypothetical protein
MSWIVLADDGKGDVYATGPFATSTDAERGMMEEAAQQGAVGKFGYRNTIVPLRNGKDD